LTSKTSTRLLARAGIMVGACGDQENVCLNISLGQPRTWAAGSNKSPTPDVKVLARLTQLSLRTVSKLTPSSAELERAYIEKKQHDLQQQRRRNQKSCYSAIHCPDNVVRGATARGRSLTVPKEFNLSASRATTPAQSVSSADEGSDASDCDASSGWSHSLRRRHQRAGSREQRAWQPRLTVPEGPALRSANRARSTSSKRSARQTGHGECPSPSPSDGSCNSICSVQSVRGRSHSRRAAHYMAGTPSPSRSVQSCRSPSSTASDMSLVSARSHLSRLSCLPQRHRSRDKLSSGELERLEVEAKRKEVQTLMRQNKKVYHNAIYNPSSRSIQRTPNLTVPQEFNLSCGSAKERFCRRGTSAERPSAPPLSADPSRKMKLTVPEEPQLLTAHRSKRASSKEATRQRSTSKHRLAREQAAIEQHLGRVAAARILQGKSGKSGTAASLQNQTRAENEQWVREAPDAEERAQRARLAAQAEHEAALAAQKQRLCIF